MPQVYRVSVENTVMRGERREYIVEATSCGTAEEKAVARMKRELRKEPGRFYAASVEFIGNLIR